MKKLLLTASLMLGFCGLVRAEPFEVPSAQTSQQAYIFYGGVKYATSSFSSFVATVAYTGSTTTASADYGISVYGVLFSTGACGDYVDIFDVATANAANAVAANNPRLRVYNVSGSTTSNLGFAAAAGGTCAGYSGLLNPNPVPVRIKTRAWFRPSTAEYNSITLYYWKPE